MGSKINLSLPWIVFDIQGEKFCINTVFTKGIFEYRCGEHTVGNSITDTTYVYCDRKIRVINGRNLIADLCNKGNPKEEFNERLHEIKIEHISWINDLDWCISNNDTFEKIIDTQNNYITRLIEYIDTNKLGIKEKRLASKMIEPLSIIVNLANKALILREHENKESLKILEEIKRESNKYIIGTLNKLIDMNNSQDIMQCIVIAYKEKTFALLVDKIDQVGENEGTIDKTCENRFSSGSVIIKGKRYNTINVTKLYNLIH